MADQQAWVLNQLQQLKTPDNQIVIDAAIALIQDQQTEIESLRGAMEGRLWSPNQWREP